jgi:hypothetical protein
LTRLSFVSYPNGSSKEENLEIAPQHAASSSRPPGGELCRVPELWRDQAAASPLRRLRPL